MFTFYYIKIKFYVFLIYNEIGIYVINICDKYVININSISEHQSIIFLRDTNYKFIIYVVHNLRFFSKCLIVTDVIYVHHCCDTPHHLQSGENFFLTIAIIIDLLQYLYLLLYSLLCLLFITSSKAKIQFLNTVIIIDLL